MIYAIEFIFRRQYRFEKFNIGGIFVKRINFDYWKQTQLYFDISRKRRYGYCYIYTLDTEVSCCIEF